MHNEQLESLSDAELDLAKGGVTIDLSSFAKPWATTIAGPLVGGILDSVSKLLSGIFGSLSGLLGIR